jgi:glycosyltransferase involved in cell wall biosynthesis
MKVLWFANMPCGASQNLGLNLNINGWLTSLEEQLVQIEDVKLSVCFYWSEKLDPFTSGETTYYPVFRARSGSKAGRLINRVFHLNSDDNEVQQLLKIVEAAKPDIVHVHGTENNFGLIQSFINVPVVVSLQGILLPYVGKFFSGIPLLPAFWYERLMPKILFKSVHYTYKDLQRCAERERKIFSQSSYIIGRTEWDRRISQLLAEKSSYYIGNEILRGSFYKETWNKKRFENPLHLVTVMSGGLYKGLEVVVKTAQILCESKDFDFQWTIIGQRESDDVVKIVKRWLTVDFKKININLVGSKGEAELAGILLNSDIYCQVSHIENSPNSLCEAMLLGMPIIASFAGGTDSMLANGKEGLLIQDGDAYSLAGTIVEMSQNFSDAAVYGSNAQLRAKNRHNKSEIANSLVVTYKDVLDKEHVGKYGIEKLKETI